VGRSGTDLRAGALSLTGGLAGALYGLEGIPARWLDALLCREDIENYCDKMSNAWMKA
jgi:ADP-ribosylglycohydrolase